MIGPPATIQTDQGTEFKGVVELLSSLMNIKIIRSRPYHPQSRGKVSAKTVIYTSFLTIGCICALCMK